MTNRKQITVGRSAHHALLIVSKGADGIGHMAKPEDLTRFLCGDPQTAIDNDDTDGVGKATEGGEVGRRRGTFRGTN